MIFKYKKKWLTSLMQNFKHIYNISNRIKQQKMRKFQNNKIIHFNNFDKSFNILNKCIDNNLKDQLFNLIPYLFNYEEEGEKLNFDILIIKDFKSNQRKLPTYLFQKITSSNKDGLNLRKSIKSIAPFSSNGWNIFISELNDEYEFGIYKDFSSENFLGLHNILKQDEYIEIEKYDNNMLKFTSENENFILHISVTTENTNNNRKKILNY